MYDVAIIGCGVIGAAAAYALSQYKLDVVMLEKENDVAMGASRANSAIIHAGYDPKPGTLMAKLNVEGNAMTEAQCRALSVPFRRVGSLVIAFSEAEMETLRALYRRGVENGVPGLEIWDADRLRREEPEVSAQAQGALFAPTAGIISPWDYTLAFAETAVTNGARLLRSTEVTGISPAVDHYVLHTNRGDVAARYVVNAAGVESGRVHEMVADRTFEIRPSRGEYYLMDKCEGGRAHHVLFQCPHADGKGVLVAPTVDGNLIVGPNAQGVDSERDVIDLAAIKSPGLSSAPAIAKLCVELLRECGLEAEAKEHPVTTREKVRFKHLSDAEKQKALQKNPLYGRVICRCETITEGEIVDAMHSPIPPCSVDGVKRRAGSGMGRCQGGFCGPRVLDILSREMHIDPLSVLQDGEGSFILLSETKREAAKK